jgi:hypothetical protein
MENKTQVTTEGLIEPPDKSPKSQLVRVCTSFWHEKYIPLFTSSTQYTPG